MLFSGFYGIYLYVVCCHGGGFCEGALFSLGVREFLNFFSHFVFLILFIFCLDYFFLWLFSLTIE